MLNVELPDEGFARPQATLSRKRERALSTSSTAIGTAAATRGERQATLQRLRAGDYDDRDFTNAVRSRICCSLRLRHDGIAVPGTPFRIELVTLSSG